MKKTSYTSNGHQRLRKSLKFLSFSLSMLFIAISANAMTEGDKVSLSLKNSNLPAILKEIKNQTKYDFMYNSREIDINKKISVELRNVTLDSALRVCLPPFGLMYTMKEKIIILKRKQEVNNQQMAQQVVSGQVKDKNGIALPGVAVIKIPK